MAAETFTMRLLGAMDTLWFHQIILFSEQSLLQSPEITKTPLPTSESAADFSSRNSSQISETSDQEISSLASIITNSQDESNSCHEITDHDDEETTTDIKDRPKRLHLSSTKTRFQSYSPLSSQKRSRRLRYSRKLEKSMSCKSLGELEIEEVKGFMDLGFVFKKENLSKNMISLIPGLQRIESRELITNNSENVEEEEEEDDDNDDYEENKRVMRPYLSEAWIIKRPDSPLLNLRIPRVSTAEDMKKHLKNWARTVASAVQLES